MGVLLLAIGLSGLGIALAQEAGPGDRQFDFRTAGAIDNSRDGQAILTADGLAPGASVSGTVTLGNSSGEDAGVTLSQSIRSEGAGIGGGLLLNILLLEIRDTSAGTLVYLGPARGMGTAVLPNLADGTARTYSFKATLPGTATIALLGASASLDYEWAATGLGSDRGEDGDPPGGDTSGGNGGTVGPVPAPACAIGKLGTRRANVLAGTTSGDRIVGRAGNDRITGLDGADCLFGGTGNDRMDGGSGDDQLRGGAGRDVLAGGMGKDLISGGAGNDTVRARDGVAERIRCGSGVDKAITDRIDRTASCERVRRR